MVRAQSDLVLQAGSLRFYPYFNNYDLWPCLWSCVRRAESLYTLIIQG